jgi:cytochrome c biogenesis protein
MTIRQLPGFAFRSVSDYQSAMAAIHARYDPAFGAGLVDALEALGAFRVFTSTWFAASVGLLAVSIVVCTLERTPRLWRQAADVRIVQPDPYYDPRLPDRAEMTGLAAADVRGVMRRHGFRVREATTDDATHLYGDRHQYTKMATLLTHLGLLLFLVAALVTSLFGKEQGVVVAEGDTATVQPIGTPGLMVMKNISFEAPGFAETGVARDFTTDLAVYRDGTEIARKTIRVNDPLEVDGWTFHENGFGPTVDLVVRGPDGKPLWDGPVPLTDAAAGSPYGTQAVPGRDLGLELLLQRGADGAGAVLVLPYRIVGQEPDGSPTVQRYPPMALASGEGSISQDAGIAVEVTGFGEYVVVIAKQDPGIGFVWAAFASLISGIVITFYLPRRRIWARLTADGRLGLVARSDRYVDLDREFGRFLGDLVAQRRPA